MDQIEEFNNVIKRIVKLNAYKFESEILTPFQYAILNYINNNKLSTASQISNNFKITISAVMHVLEYLLNEELIIKKVLSDKRKKGFMITKKGEDIITNINKKKEKSNLYIFENLGSDFYELLRILKKVLNLMEEKNERGL